MNPRIILPSGRRMDLDKIQQIIPSEEDNNLMVDLIDGFARITKPDDAAALLRYWDANAVTLTPTGYTDPSEPGWLHEPATADAMRRMQHAIALEEALEARSE